MKRWYVVQVYAGYEEAARKDILKRVIEAGAQELFGEAIAPAAHQKGGVDENEQQLFPGYVLVEMDVSPEAIRIVKQCPRVLRFLGGGDPLPLTKKEVDRMTLQMKGEVIVAPKRDIFVVGSEIEILDGPFSGFVGIVDKVNTESDRLSVMVSIFGRMTPVELGFHQVKQ